MATGKEELERLLALKKLAVLNQEELKEKMKLEMKHKRFLESTYEEMDARLKTKTLIQAVLCAPEVEHTIADYNSKYSEASWYQEPKLHDDGSVTFTFTTEDECSKFFLSQCEKGEPFILCDSKTKQVTAYSNGDGQLYHADGKVFAPGDRFKASDIKVEDFEIPGLEQGATHSGPR